MDRRSFLNFAWKNNIKPLLIIAGVIFVGILLLKIDFTQQEKSNLNQSENSGINWSAVVELAIEIFRNYWQWIAGFIGYIVIILFLQKRIPSSYQKKFQRVRSIIEEVAVLVLFCWLLYSFYTKKEYGNLIFYAILFVILYLRRLFNRRNENQTTIA